MGDRNKIIRRDYLYDTTLDPKVNIVKNGVSFLMCPSASN